MLVEHIAIVGFVLVLVYVYSKRAFAGFLVWITFALACIVKIPEFLSRKDYFNTAVSVPVILFFLFSALTTIRRNSNVMQEVATLLAIACAIYFPFSFIPSLKMAIIEETAKLTVSLGNALGFPMMLNGSTIELNDRSVEIILPCTAIEGMSVFAGVILGTRAEFSRKLKAFLVSIPTIYVYNIFRNIFVIVSFGYSWFGENSFYIAHNIVAKIFSTLVFIVLVYIILRMLPELMELLCALKDEILQNVSLIKRLAT